MELNNFEGDMFWDANDPEQSMYDPEEALYDVCPGDIVEFQQARTLPNFYGVDCGENSRGFGRYRYFDTEEDALACSLQVRNPVCKHENCKRPYGAHANGPIDTAKMDYESNTEIGRWVWKNLACPIGPEPFHPTQTFKEKE